MALAAAMEAERVAVVSGRWKRAPGKNRRLASRLFYLARLP